MKFTVAQQALLKALQTVVKGAATNSTMPILTGVLLKATDGTLEMQTTDLSISIKHQIPAFVEEVGESVVSVKTLMNIAKVLPDAAVQFEASVNTIAIRCERSSFNLNTLKAADFPEFPEITAENSVELPNSILSEMGERVHRVTSKDTSRPTLCGVFLTVEQNTVRLVATDSYRLSVVDAHIETSSLAGEFKAIIPGNALKDALSLAGDEGPVQIGVASSQVIFSFGTTVFVSRRIEGNYPDYRRLLPASCATSIKIGVRELSDALKRMSILATTSPNIRFDIDTDGALITLSAASKEMGDANEQVNIDDPQGEPIVIALNHRYVSDCITGLEPDEIIDLELQSPTLPAIFKSYGTINYLYLLMPAHL